MPTSAAPKMLLPLAFRLVLVALLLVVSLLGVCANPVQTLVAQYVLLAIVAVGPPALYYGLQHRWPQYQGRWRLLVGGLDLVLLTLLNYVSLQHQGVPLYFPLYLVVGGEGVWWWGWKGGIGWGAAGSALLALLCASASLQAPLASALAAALLILGWAALFAVVMPLPRQVGWRHQGKRSDPASLWSGQSPR